MHRLLLALLLFLILPAGASALDATVKLKSIDQLDEAGGSLRRALNGYEAALASPFPSVWTRATLGRERTLRLGADVFVMLRNEGGESRLMVIDANGPKEEALLPGKEVVVGPLRALLLYQSSRGGTAEVMLRAVEEPALLSDKLPTKSKVKIEGFEKPPAIRLSGVDRALVNFGEAYLKAWLETGDPTASAKRARDEVPVVKSLPLDVADAAARGEYTDSTNYFDPEGDDAPSAAVVTLRLIRGDSESLGVLATELSYDNQGRSNTDPRITAGSGPEGGEVTFGSAGDRFQGRLRVLERNGKVQTQGETLLRVPLGSGTDFSIDTQNGGLRAYMTARRAGRDGVELKVSRADGDPNFVGTLNTSVRVRDGRTVLLAQNNSTRTSTQTSGVPILSGIPYLGPAFGSEVKETLGSSYALYATMVLD